MKEADQESSISFRFPASFPEPLFASPQALRSCSPLTLWNKVMWAVWLLSRQ